MLFKAPHPYLVTRCNPVTDISDVLPCIPEMLRVLAAHEGVGLAAPQVGVLKRLFMVKTPLGIPWVFVNPEITVTDPTEERSLEGCLSIPDRRFFVSRPRGIHIKAFNLEGEPFELNLKGWYARVCQHENDHLNGILISSK